MAANLLNGFQNNGLFSLILCVLLANEVFSSDGVCTRNEVVSKSRPHNYYETFMETYTDWCYERYYGNYRCTKTRQSQRLVTDQESYTTLETKQFCCAGYEDARKGGVTLECKPVCDFICPNGKCTRPNYCDCNSGYTKKPGTENICEPVCSHECLHGYCSKPEICDCDFGYEHNSSLTFICSPVCSNPCVNANCTSPEVCTCLQGFAKTLKEPHKCHAVCSLHCHNGVCTLPDECTCFEGYERDNSTWNVCSPVCSEGCSNGVCTAPGECTCFDGFEKISRSICEPECSQGCVNGRCTRPEVCSCFPGYQSFLDDPYSCFPVCSPGCVNGNCTEPDRCECFPGFEESDDPRICRPYCSDGCDNGVCSSPEECKCLWGFESEGNSSICTQREGENLDCTFIDEIVNHNFDKYCFKLTRELFLKSLGNCKILEYLASHIVEIKNALLDLYCEGTSDLEQSENSFKLRLKCVGKLISKEDKLSSEEFSSTLAYTDDQSDFTDSFESNTQISSSETLLMTEDTITVETSEMQNTTDKSQMETLENDREQAEFHITYVGISSTKLSALPLHLNTTLKFLPVIENSQMTQDYFVNATSLKMEWCLCHQNQKNWSICASSAVRLYLCPCEPRNSQILMEEQRTASFLKTLTKLVLFSMAALLVGYILYNVYQSGTYETQRSADNNSGKPVLSFDLASLAGSSAEENT